MAPALPPQRILCIKLKHIGDVLLMTPAVRALRRAWPECAVAALVPRGTEEVLAGNPDLTAVFVLDREAGYAGDLALVRALRRFEPDLVLEMGQGDREAILGWLSGARRRVGYVPGGPGAWRRMLLTRAVPWNGWQHVVETNLDLVRACGVAAEASRPVLVVQPELRVRMAERLTEAGMGPGQRLAVVHPVSRWLFKAWPEASCAEAIIRLVREIPVAVALTSGPRSDEIETANRILARAQLGRGGGPIINLIGHTSVGELAALLELASLFVGVDSAPMHMAAALGVPVVALFGPSGEMSWGPWGEGHAVIASPYLCRPCGRDGCLGSKRSDCLEAITTDEVMRVVTKVMGRSPGRSAFERSTVRLFGSSVGRG